MDKIPVSVHWHLVLYRDRGIEIIFHYSNVLVRSAPQDYTEPPRTFVFCFPSKTGSPCVPTQTYGELDSDRQYRSIIDMCVSNEAWVMSIACVDGCTCNNTSGALSWNISQHSQAAIVFGSRQVSFPFMSFPSDRRIHAQPKS